MAKENAVAVHLTRKGNAELDCTVPASEGKTYLGTAGKLVFVRVSTRTTVLISC